MQNATGNPIPCRDRVRPIPTLNKIELEEGEDTTSPSIINKVICSIDNHGIYVLYLRPPFRKHPRPSNAIEIPRRQRQLRAVREGGMEQSCVQIMQMSNKREGDQEEGQCMDPQLKLNQNSGRPWIAVAAGSALLLVYQHQSDSSYTQT